MVTTILEDIPDKDPYEGQQEIWDLVAVFTEPEMALKVILLHPTSPTSATECRSLPDPAVELLILIISIDC